MCLEFNFVEQISKIKACEFVSRKLSPCWTFMIVYDFPEHAGHTSHIKCSACERKKKTKTKKTPELACVKKVQWAFTPWVKERGHVRSIFSLLH